MIIQTREEKGGKEKAFLSFPPLAFYVARGKNTRLFLLLLFSPGKYVENFSRMKPCGAPLPRSISGVITYFFPSSSTSIVDFARPRRRRRKEEEPTFPPEEREEEK